MTTPMGMKITANEKKVRITDFGVRMGCQASSCCCLNFVSGQEDIKKSKFQYHSHTPIIECAFKTGTDMDGKGCKTTPFRKSNTGPAFVVVGIMDNSIYGRVRKQARKAK